MKGHDLGKGVTILREHFQSECEAYEDLSLFGASDCGGLVGESYEKKFRFVRRHIKAVTGLKFREFRRECRRRTSPKWMYYYFPGGF